MGKRSDTEAAGRRDDEKGLRSGVVSLPELELVGSPKREAILQGMLEAVGSEGYERTSVRTVLDRAGVYRQAFYDNFSDKDDCYLQALDAGVRRIETAMAEAAAAESSWTGRLRAGLATLLDFLDANPDGGRALLVEIHAAGPEALVRRAAAMDRANAFLELAREEGGEAGSPPPIAGEGVAAGIHAVIHSRLASGARDGFRQLLPEFMYFAVLPYFGAERARAEMQLAKG